jgi:hypothetical protein
MPPVEESRPERERDGRIGMQIIQGDDELARLHETGAGFVYNDFSGTSASGAQYNVLHAAGCSWVAKSNVNVRKLFFETLEEATAWLLSNRGAEGSNWKRCGTCRARGTHARSSSTTNAPPVPKQLHSAGIARLREPGELPGWTREPTVIAAIIGLVGTVLTLVVSVWISSRRDEPRQQRQPDRSAESVIQKRDEPSRPARTEPPEEKGGAQNLALDDILDILERHHQRATFGAVAGILGREPISLFEGYSRTPRTAWVVNKNTGLPTGTKEIDYPAGLLQTKRIIDAPQDLRAWLRDHH